MLQHREVFRYWTSTVTCARLAMGSVGKACKAILVARSQRQRKTSADIQRKTVDAWLSSDIDVQALREVFVP